MAVLLSRSLQFYSFVFDLQAKSLTVWETREICRPVIFLPLWQTSAFGRAAGGLAPLPCWNPDETLGPLVMKSGHQDSPAAGKGPLFYTHDASHYTQHNAKRHGFTYGIFSTQKKLLVDAIQLLLLKSMLKLGMSFFLIVCHRKRGRPFHWKVSIAIHCVRNSQTTHVVLAQITFHWWSNLGYNHHSVNLYYSRLNWSTKHGITIDFPDHFRICNSWYIQ